MRLGIIGTGQIGGTLARLLVASGQEVMLSFARETSRLHALAAELGDLARVGTPAESAHFGEFTVLAVHFAALDEALTQAGSLHDVVLLDTSNPVDIKLPNGMSGAQEIFRRTGNSYVVKAFNTLGAQTLLASSGRLPRSVIPICGDHLHAKTLSARVVEACGYTPFDIGGLERAALQEPGGPFFNVLLDGVEARAVLDRALQAMSDDV